MKKITAVWALLAVTVSTGVRAGDQFERKAGLWKITLQRTSTASIQTADQCLADDTDARLAKSEMSTLRSLCSKIEHRKVGKTFVTDTECKIGAHAKASVTVITPDGDSAYQMVITTHAAGASNSGKPDEVSTQAGRWAGPCPAGMRPGDQILHIGPQMPNGMKTNLLDAAND